MKICERSERPQAAITPNGPEKRTLFAMRIAQAARTTCELIPPSSYSLSSASSATVISSDAQPRPRRLALLPSRGRSSPTPLCRPKRFDPLWRPARLLRPSTIPLFRGFRLTSSISLIASVCMPRSESTFGTCFTTATFLLINPHKPIDEK